MVFCVHTVLVCDHPYLDHPQSELQRARGRTSGVLRIPRPLPHLGFHRKNGISVTWHPPGWSRDLSPCFGSPPSYRWSSEHSFLGCWLHH